jgi:alginate O-acetyltransferase complex protein AlgI
VIFNSLNFVIFLAVVLAGYVSLRHKGQNRWLLAASYFFYGSWDWRFLSLIALTTGVDYFVSHKLAAATSHHKRKRLLCFSLVVNLSVLGFFKYFNFFIGSGQALLLALGWRVDPWMVQIVLPVGISFYTFQSLSYTVDVYRGQVKPADSLLDYALYVSFFPQLVAGPIERATHLLPQVLNPRVMSWERTREACWLVLWGLFKKVVIADNLAVIADNVFSGNYEATTLNVLVGVYAFAFQIYCDFSAYSDIARGVARLLGFDLMLNFNNPYFARNPSEFWRRWHISLSTWLRDYLYIPLGGNRNGRRRTYLNLFLTMLLGGLWHGAAWTFVAWGVYQGVLLMAHRAWVGDGGRVSDSVNRVSSVLSIMLMFHFACVGWVLFRADTLGQAGVLLAGLLAWGEFTLSSLSPWIALAVLCAPLWVIQVFQEKTSDALAPLRLPLIPQAALLGFLLAGIWAVGNTGSKAFIYFQF